jgi:hypothetical protein
MTPLFERDGRALDGEGVTMSRKFDRPRRSRSSLISMKRPSASRRYPTYRRGMRATFDSLVLQNPRLATATLAVLKIIAGSNRRRAMQLIEAMSAVVIASPTRVPGPEGRDPRWALARDRARRGVRVWCATW